VPVALGRLSA